jgi:hypothetical protein
LTIYHDLPRDARLWSFLHAIDQDLAETTRKGDVPAVDACAWLFAGMADAGPGEESDPA